MLVDGLAVFHAADGGKESQLYRANHTRATDGIATLRLAGSVIELGSRDSPRKPILVHGPVTSVHLTEACPSACSADG